MSQAAEVTRLIANLIYVSELVGGEGEASAPSQRSLDRQAKAEAELRAAIAAQLAGGG